MPVYRLLSHRLPVPQAPTAHRNLRLLTKIILFRTQAISSQKVRSSTPSSTGYQERTGNAFVEGCELHAMTGCQSQEVPISCSVWSLGPRRKFVGAEVVGQKCKCCRLTFLQGRKCFPGGCDVDEISGLSAGSDESEFSNGASGELGLACGPQCGYPRADSLVGLVVTAARSMVGGRT